MVIGFIMSLVIGNLPAFQMVGTSVLLNIKQGNYTQAYSVFSPEYKKRLPLENFINFAATNRLNLYKDVKWLKTVVNKDKKTGYILGDMTLGENEITPIEFQFVKVPAEGVYQHETWYIDDMYVGKDVVIRQSQMLSDPPSQ
jgi:hypothetical protein